MAGPIPKVSFPLRCHMPPAQHLTWFILQDSYALIAFAAVCVVATAFAALYYLPIVALFFADVSAETKD
jgi:hypothetical protein